MTLSLAADDAPATSATCCASASESTALRTLVVDRALAVLVDAHIDLGLPRRVLRTARVVVDDVILGAPPRSPVFPVAAQGP